MYTKAAVLATSATSLPMWGPEGYRMVPLPNMVADFRDSMHLIGMHLIGVYFMDVHLMERTLRTCTLWVRNYARLHQKASWRRKRRRYRSQQPRNKGRPYLQRQQGWQERRRLRIGARESEG